MKKALSFVLALTMACALLTACGAKAPSKDTPAGSSAASKEQGLEGSLLSADPVSFSIFLNFNNMPFNPEWRVWQEVAKRTNISLNGIIAQSNSNEEEAFNLMLSSGELADIIGFVKASELEKLGRDGAVIPLNDLIKEHAPDIQKMMDSDPKFAQSCYSLDGNIYQIPKNQELMAAEFWWIRQDWLDKLNLKMPSTVDELYTVLSAFKNDDPNGNGLKDEIPLFDRAGDKMPDEYLYLWDTSTEFFARDGVITFEPMEENFKTGVSNIAKWYKEGIVDPEIFTRGAKSRDTLLSGNLGGCTHDWVSTGNYNDSLAADIPDFAMVPFAPPADQNGKILERTTRFPGAGWSISSMCEDPVTVIKFMNFMFTEEGSNLMNWGIEGETYTVNGSGEKEYTDAVMNSDLSPIGYLRSLGVQYRIGMHQTGDYEYAFMTDIGRVANEMYNTNPAWFMEDMPPYADGKLDLKYFAEDESDYQKIMANIREYVDERFQSWMLGTSDFETDYDAFIAELKNRGIEKAIEINQRAYDAYLGKTS